MFREQPSRLWLIKHLPGLVPSKEAHAAILESFNVLHYHIEYVYRAFYFGNRGSKICYVNNGYKIFILIIPEFLGGFEPGLNASFFLPNGPIVIMMMKTLRNHG